MYKQKIIISILSLVLFCSCSSSDDNEHVDSYALDLIIESTHTFKAGDAIGLFVEKRADKNTQSRVGASNYKTNAKWIYQQDGTWKPATANDMIYTATDGMPLDVYAYYPYTEEATASQISIVSAVPVMTGSVLNMDNNQKQIKLTLLNKMALVKIIVPDMDILSTTELTMIGIRSGGKIDPAKLGDENDFVASTSESNQPLAFENGYFVAYLPEQTFNENKHLLDIKDNKTTIAYNITKQLNIAKNKENVIVANRVLDNLSDSPNTFMLQPGNDLFISVQKAYKIWKENSLLATTAPDLTGEVSAKIVWQEDSYNVVENVELIGSGKEAVIHVKTKADKVGNAVIAVTIGDNIRWSWQLWVSDYNPLLKENGTTYDFNGLTFMDRNLGATINPKNGGDRTFGLYYQWGRKDPFPTRGNITMAAVTANINTNLANSITQPNTYITSSTSPYDWYTKTGNAGLDRWNSADNKKTPFDPCPKGWRVPATGVDNKSPWDGLALPTDENKWGNGWYFDETTQLGYYPAAGQRTYAGAVSYTGSAGFYYAAKATETMRLDFTSISFGFGGGRAAARSIRCVKELE